VQKRIRKVHVLRRPKAKSPFWYLRYWELQRDGKTWKERWRSTKTTVKKEAETLRRRLERELDEGKLQDEEMRWEDFSVEFLDKHAGRKAPTTQLAYRLCLEMVGKTVKPRYVSSVTTSLLEDFANARLKDGVKEPTVNKELRHLKAALRWALRRGYLKAVPDFSGVFIRTDAQPPVAISEDDFVTIIKALESPKLKLEHRSKGWWRTFLYLAYYLGLRRGELVGLTWNRVRFDTQEINIAAQTSKGRKHRVLPLHPALANILKRWQEEQKASESGAEVLPWHHDTYRSLYDDWHAIQSAAGIKEGEHYVPKDFRSSCASELIRAGVPTAVVKDMLGHQHITTTERYYINTKPALRAAVERREVRLIDPCSTSVAPNEKGEPEKDSPK
jgi:integrase